MTCAREATQYEPQLDAVDEETDSEADTDTECGSEFDPSDEE